MGEKTINQHYVPTSYIDRFADDDGRICVYKKQSKEILENQYSRNFASERYFNDLTIAELEECIRPNFIIPKSARSAEQFIERYLCSIEGEAIDCMKRIESDYSLLHDEDIKIILCIYFTTLSMRTRKMRNLFGGFIEQLSVFNKSYSLSQDMQYYLSCSDKETHLRLLMNQETLLKKTMMLAEQYTWNIGINNTEASFVISDNPLQGVFTNCNDICIPIAPKVAIILRTTNSNGKLFTKETPTDNKINLLGESVTLYNALQFDYANMFLFGRKIDLQVLRFLDDCVEHIK